MLRHDQHNLECTQDENGNEVKSKNTKLVKSPMTRATETANIILSMMREGALYW